MAKDEEIKEDAVPLLAKEMSEEGTQTSISDESDAPPPYDSLTDKAKRCQEETVNTFDFLHTGATMLLETGGWTLFMVILLALPVTSVILGSLYKDQCQKQRFIPIYLIVAGSFSIVRQSLDLFERLQRSPDDDPDFKNLSCNLCKCCQGLINLFLFGWFIAGNVWIYTAYKPNYTDPTSKEYCHKTVYLFSFWLTTAVYIVMATLCCCASCVTCCVVGSTFFRKENL